VWTSISFKKSLSANQPTNEGKERKDYQRNKTRRKMRSLNIYVCNFENEIIANVRAGVFKTLSLDNKK